MRRRRHGRRDARSRGAARALVQFNPPKKKKTAERKEFENTTPPGQKKGELCVCVSTRAALCGWVPAERRRTRCADMSRPMEDAYYPSAVEARHALLRCMAGAERVARRRHGMTGGARRGTTRPLRRCVFVAACLVALVWVCMRHLCRAGRQGSWRRQPVRHRDSAAQRDRCVLCDTARA